VDRLLGAVSGADAVHACGSCAKLQRLCKCWTRPASIVSGRLSNSVDWSAVAKHALHDVAQVEIGSVDVAKFDDAYFKPTEKKDKKKGEAEFFQVGSGLAGCLLVPRALDAVVAVCASAHAAGVVSNG
jgi:hypothetical protein